MNKGIGMISFRACPREGNIKDVPSRGRAIRYKSPDEKSGGFSLLSLTQKNNSILSYRNSYIVTRTSFL